MTPEAKIFRKAARLVFEGEAAGAGIAILRATQFEKFGLQHKCLTIGRELFPEIDYTQFKNQEHRVMALLLAGEIVETGL